MPKELKFRVWDKESKLMMPVEELIWDKGAIYLIWALRAEDGEDGIGYDMAPDEAQIMQFTGLHDSQGREIYEGDVVRISWETDDGEHPSTVGLVDFADGSFYVKTRTGGYYYWTGYEVEVLGNVHQNPELLEGLTCK